MSEVVLVTGASTGLGAAIAIILAPNNDVIIHYNQSKDAAENVAEKVKDNGGRPILMQADLTTERACIDLVDKLKRQFQRLDLLVNNAGAMIKRQTARELEWEHMIDTFNLNTFSTMKLSSLCIPLLEKVDNPCIINITSMAIRTGAASATVYGASKGAIDSFTRGLAKELAPKIRVNAVASGAIDTPFHKKVSTPEKMKQFKEESPLKRVGEADHIALTVKFLVDNDYITGETIDVNGGRFMR